MVRGLGLAFVDLVVLLYEGRGGRFAKDGEGLRYVPSGQEPYLVAGSPRGAPYHAKTHYQLRAGRPPLPRFFGPSQVDPLLASGGPVDMATQVWPLMAKEIAWGWYHELGRGHPERVRMPWAEFADRFAALGWGTPAMEALLADAVPDPLDRLDLAALDRPLDGVRADSLEALQPQVQARIAEDLRQHVDHRHTPHLGAFVAMLSVYSEWEGSRRCCRSGRRRSTWAGGRASSTPSRAVRRASGCGSPRAGPRGLRAVPRAGHAGRIADGAFRATSAAIPGAVTAPVLVDARLPDPSASRSTDPLVAALLRDGAAVRASSSTSDGALLRNTGQIAVRPADGALVDAAGRVHPRRFAMGRTPR